MIKRIDEDGRTCSKCGTYKLWDEFTPDRRVKTGHSAKCKACKAAWLRGYTATPEGKAKTTAAQERYRSGEANKARAEELKKMRRDPTYVPDPKVYRSENRSEVDPIKAAARAAVHREVAAGRMPAAKDVACAFAFKGNCRGHSQYHHRTSYRPEDALDVLPLCVGHHVREHLRLEDRGTTVTY